MDATVQNKYYRISFGGSSFQLNKWYVQWAGKLSLVGLMYKSFQSKAVLGSSVKAFCDYSISTVVNSAVYNAFSMVPIQIEDIGIIFFANVTISLLLKEILNLSSRATTNISIFTCYLSIFYYYGNFIRNYSETLFPKSIVSITSNAMIFTQISWLIFISTLVFDSLSKKMELNKTMDFDIKSAMKENADQKLGLLFFFYKDIKLSYSIFKRDFMKIEVIGAIFCALISYNYINFDSTNLIVNSLRTLLIGWLSFNAIHLQVSCALLLETAKSEMDQNVFKAFLYGLSILPLLLGFIMFPAFFSLLIHLI